MAKHNANRAAEVTNKGIYKTLRLLVHLTAAVQFSYAVYYDYTYVHFPVSDTNMHNPFGGKFKYLTFLDAILQALYYIISFMNDIVGTNDIAPKKVPALRKIKDYILPSLAFPIALNVAVTFWSLYAIDRELVFPRVLDAVFPVWLNHVMHTNIVVFILLEMFITFRKYPKRSSGIAGLVLFMGIYLIWLHVVKHFSGVWVYPVLEVLELPQRIVFFVATLAFTLSLYLFGEFLNKTIWAKELRLLQRKTT